MSWRGEVVAVTGASAGVGRAVANAFAAEGASVGLLARPSSRLKEAAEEIEGEGGRALPLEVDVADAGKVDEAAAALEDEFGQIGVWVNSAMVSVFAPFSEMTAEEFRRVTEVTYLGYVHGTMAALKRMRPRDRGCIVQVGSALAYRAIPLQSAYCGAKHAIEGFTESLRCELIHDSSHVKVTAVHLPALNTPQFHWVKTTLSKHPQPVPPIYQPEIAADAILWAARRAPRELWLGYPTVGAILANRLFPGLLDLYLGKRGYASQQADRPIEPNRPHNLWEPVETELGAHGEFEDRARKSSLHWWARKNRLPLALSAATGALTLIGLRARD